MRMSELLNEVRRFELDEGFSPREIKMAIGIASDPRYAKGNMTGAVNAIEKMKKGLSKHPQVMAVLKRQNEKVETDEAVSPAQQAAIAISKKERGEKPKKEKDEGNTFGKELKAARDKGEKTFVVSGKKYNVEDLDTKDEPKVKEIIKKLKGASQAHAGQAKDLEKAVSEKVEPSRIVEPYRPEFGLDEISTFSRAHIAILKKTFDPMRNKKLGPKGQAKLSKIMDMIGDKKDALIDLFKADIPFVSQSAAAKLITKYNMKGDEINKLKEEVEIDEASKEGTIKIIKTKDGKFQIQKMTKGKFVDIGKPHNSAKEAEKFRSGQPDLFGEEVELDEKYDLYHKDFSSAMQHAYSYAKSKMGITVDPKEIDSKVATGPKKPTEGKTNKYMLKGKGGNLQIQVYNKGGSKPFELNMYKEENQLIAAAVGHLSND